MHRHRRLEHFEQVPRNSFSLAVLVRREVEGVRPLELLAQFRHLLLGVRCHDVHRSEAMVDVDAEPGFLPGIALLLWQLGSLGRDVANVADRGFHDEVSTEVLRDSARLCGRLHNHEFFGHVLWPSGQGWRQRIREYGPVVKEMERRLGSRDHRCVGSTP